MEQTRRFRKGFMAKWYIIGIVSILVCLFVLSVTFIGSVAGLIPGLGDYSASIPGAYPFAGVTEAVKTTLKSIPSYFMGIENVTNWVPFAAQMGAWVIAFFVVVYFFAHVITFIAKRKWSYFIHSILALCMVSGLVGIYFSSSYVLSGYQTSEVITNGGNVTYLYVRSLFLTGFEGTIDWTSTNVWMCVIYWALAVIFVVALILAVVSVFAVSSYPCNFARKYVKGKAKEAKDKKAEEEGRYGYGPEGMQAIPANGQGVYVNTGNATPYVVQYFYGNQPAAPAAAPAEPVKEAEKAPVAEAKPGLTKEDLKEVLSELMAKKEEDEKAKAAALAVAAPIAVPAPAPAPAPVVEEKVDPVEVALEEIEKHFDLVDYEDVKTFIAGEVDKAAQEAIRQLEKQREELEKAKAAETKEEATVAYKEEKPVVQEEKPAPVEEAVKVVTPIVVAVPSDYPREAKAPVEEVEEVNEEDIRSLIKDEIRSAFASLKEEAPEEECGEEADDIHIEYVYEDEYVEAAPVVEEVVKEEPAPVAEPVKEEAPVVEEKPVEVAPVVEEVKPAPAPKRVIPQKEVRGKEEAIEKGEIVKLAFDERMVNAEDDIKAAYQSLKSLLLSYGLNSRVSSTGDTFRLSKKTYCKVTCSGQALKIYLALDPKSYANSAIPVNDSSTKEAYKQIPLGFRVKSDLSLRRARDLIIDCMNQNDLVPNKEFVEEDYVKALKDNLKK